MKSLNKITLIRNLGNDPEAQTLKGDIKLAKFSLLTSEIYKNSAGILQTDT